MGGFAARLSLYPLTSSASIDPGHDRMLNHLQIRDFAIVEYLELELAAGMSVVTGETGAGKSIMIDALGLLLGDRADSDVVRAGAERAEISAVFDLGGLPAASAWLSERELGSGEQDCHLRRVISRNGRSRAYIDGSPQPLQALKEFGELLVDIHGQHEHQSLLKRDLQRQLLDDYAGHQSLLAELGQHYQDWSRLRQTLAALQQAGVERDARLDLLRYQVRELETLGLQTDELAALETEHRRLANAGRLLESCQRAVGRLYENEEVSVQGLLSQTLQDLQSLYDLDAQLAPAGELLNAALIQVREASAELRHYLQRVELDPARLEWVEQRLAAIHELARKHRLPPTELPALLKRLRDERDEIDNSELRQEQLEQQMTEAFRAYSGSARELSARRTTAVAALSTRVSAAMAELGMPGGRFAIALEPLGKPSPHGVEAVEFQVSANPGQPLKSLTRVASGGELSRISLAIQVIAAHAAHIPTLIFDEVDTGIGGSVAEMVGRQLRALGKTRQVLCVTHLPQVAAQAHQHFKVNKYTDDHSTCAQIVALQRRERIEEIARMLGGLAVTANTRAHAEEMLDCVQN